MQGTWCICSTSVHCTDAMLRHAALKFSPPIPRSAAGGAGREPTERVTCPTAHKRDHLGSTSKPALYGGGVGGVLLRRAGLLPGETPRLGVRALLTISGLSCSGMGPDRQKALRAVPPHIGTTEEGKEGMESLAPPACRSAAAVTRFAHQRQLCETLTK